jgi:hypothetical protein
MLSGKLVEQMAKLPEGTPVYVRGGACKSDDLWNCKLTVWRYQGQLTACIESDWRNKEHQHYPPGANVTKEIIGEECVELSDHQG